MGKFVDLGRRIAAVGVLLALVSACSSGPSESATTSPADGWWESEPELAPENFEEQASESVDGDGATVTEAGVKVTVPGGVLDESADLTIREPLGEFGSEFGGPIVGLEHEKDLDGVVEVEWDVSELTAVEQDTLLLVRWDDAQQRWVPGDVEPEIEDGNLSADLDEWSFWSWIANAGQTGQEIIGRRADAPKCAAGPLHDWVAGVVDPDEGTNAAAVRVCFENDRDEIVTMRVVNNRTFGQFIRVDGSGGWEWVWTGKDELSAVQAVRAGAAAVFNDDRRIFVPPLHEVAVGIARPDTGGSHFIEFRNESTAETFLADVVMFAVSKLDIPTPGVERVGVLVEAVLKCALDEVVKGGAPTDLDAIARLVVSTVTSCIAEITDETSELGLAFRTMLSQRIAAYPDADAASEAMRGDRLLRSVSRALRLLGVVEAITYLGDVGAEHLVGGPRWSLRGAGKNSPLGKWEPDCGDVDRDSNLVYRNLALQDEFSDTSIELHDFPRWPEATAQAVAPLIACDTAYLADLAGYVRGDWGAGEAAEIVAGAIETLTSATLSTEGRSYEDVAIDFLRRAVDGEPVDALIDPMGHDQDGTRVPRDPEEIRSVLNAAAGLSSQAHPNRVFVPGEQIPGAVAPVSDSCGYFGDFQVSCGIEYMSQSDSGGAVRFAVHFTESSAPLVHSFEERDRPMTPPTTTVPDFGQPLQSFQSPSGNIGCMISHRSHGYGEARCDIRERSYTDPPGSESCELDHGNAFWVGDKGPGSVLCHGDTVLDSSAPVLDYGMTASHGPYRCTSATTGMTCTHTGTGHGFSVRRAGYELF